MREDILRGFGEMLQPFPKAGAKIWKQYEKENSDNSKDILLSIRAAGTEIQFISAFTYYLFAKAEHEDDDEHRQIIDALQENENDARDSDRICLLLANILFSEDPNANDGSVISDHIITLYEEITLWRYEFIGLLTIDERSGAQAPEESPYCVYLYKVLRFVCRFCSAYFTSETSYLRDSIFCVAVLSNFRIAKKGIPAASYMYNGLHVADPGCFYSAASACYHFKMSTQNYQGAYDILYSWVNKKMVGEYKNVVRFFTLEDDEWRKNNLRKTKTMYTLLSCLCSAMADMQSTASRQYAFFRDYSTTLALRNPNNEAYTPTLGMLNIHALINNREYEESKMIAQSILDKAEKQQKATILLSAIISYAGILCNHNTNNDTDDNNSKEQLVRLLHEFAAQDFDVKLGPVYASPAGLIFRIFEYIKTKEFFPSEVITSLLCTQHLVREIQRELRYDQCLRTVYITHDSEVDQTAEHEDRCCQPIAYYTSLSNLRYLFEPLYAENHRCKPKPLSDSNVAAGILTGKNCLTMMHAHYMNDPREGITLLDSLSDDIDKNSSDKNILIPKSFPTVFREQIFDNQFVFLKSFTDLVDQLNMWSMYGSDRSENTDSNGCCIRIAPESFEMMLSISHLTKILRDLDDDHDTDDLRLYKVAYVQNGQLCEGASSLLIHYYAQLKEQIRQMNTVLGKINDAAQRQQLMSFIVSTLQEILTPIIFLFKDAAYQAEKELRMIITRSRTKEDMERISKTPQNPPKLYVNPYHQVYVDQIILGPKVIQPDNWIPHLQFELTKMWESWPEKKYGKRVPSVRKSSINYRD